MIERMSALMAALSLLTTWFAVCLLSSCILLHAGLDLANPHVVYTTFALFGVTSLWAAVTASGLVTKESRVFEFLGTASGTSRVATACHALWLLYGVPMLAMSALQVTFGESSQQRPPVVPGRRVHSACWARPRVDPRVPTRHPALRAGKFTIAHGETTRRF